MKGLGTVSQVCLFCNIKSSCICSETPKSGVFVLQYKKLFYLF